MTITLITIREIPRLKSKSNSLEKKIQKRCKINSKKIKKLIKKNSKKIK